MPYGDMVDMTTRPSGPTLAAAVAAEIAGRLRLAGITLDAAAQSVGMTRPQLSRRLFTRPDKLTLADTIALAERVLQVPPSVVLEHAEAQYVRAYRDWQATNR